MAISSISPRESTDGEAEVHLVNLTIMNMPHVIRSLNIPSYVTARNNNLGFDYR